MAMLGAFVRRLCVLPMNAAIALLSIYAGAAALLHFPPASAHPLVALLPGWLTTAFNLTYLIAGVLILLGIGLGKAALEGPGLVLLVASLAVRLSAAWSFVGWGRAVADLAVYYSAIGLACVERYLTIARGDTIVRHSTRWSRDA